MRAPKLCGLAWTPLADGCLTSFVGAFWIGLRDLVELYRVFLQPRAIWFFLSFLSFWVFSGELGCLLGSRLQRVARRAVQHRGLPVTTPHHHPPSTPGAITFFMISTLFFSTILTAFFFLPLKCIMPTTHRNHDLLPGTSFPSNRFPAHSAGKSPRFLCMASQQPTHPK